MLTPDAIVWYSRLFSSTIVSISFASAQACVSHAAACMWQRAMIQGLDNTQHVAMHPQALQQLPY